MIMDANTDTNKQTPCRMCATWTEVSHTHRILTGHHSQCPNCDQSTLGAALALIADLAKGIEAWGALEDGIPDEVWHPYRKAKGLQGVFLSNERG
jgi:hypothetical protein